MIKLLKETTFHWHNLVENPDDLPNPNYPPVWYAVFIANDFSTEDENEFGWCISQAIYVPKEKKWYIAILDVDDSEIEDPFIFNPEWKQKFIEPDGKILMWAEFNYDYAMQHHELYGGKD